MLVTNLNETPVPAQMHWGDEKLTILLLEEEAGRVQIMVRTSDGGGLMASTVWLFPKLSGYRLEIELLRGTISRLRNGIQIWKANALPVPDALEQEVQLLTTALIRAWRTTDFASIAQPTLELLHRAQAGLKQLATILVQQQGKDCFVPQVKPDLLAGAEAVDDTIKQRVGDIAEPSAPPSKFSLGLSLDMAQRSTVVDLFASKDIVRRTDKSDVDDSLGFASDGPSDPHAEESLLSRLLNTKRLSLVEFGLDWKDFSASSDQEDSQQRVAILQKAASRLRAVGRRTILGSMFRIQEGCLPDGVSASSDVSSLSASFGQSLRQQLSKLASDVDMIHVVSGINGVGVAGLTPTIQSALVENALETAATIAPYTPLMISFSQPLGERLAWSVGGQNVDQLLVKLAKQKIPVHAVGLEVDLGYFPIGTLPRDPFGWIMNLQKWAVWDVPIYIFLRVPSQARPELRTKHFDPMGRAEVSGLNQMNSIMEFANFASSLPWVHGVIFSDWKDTNHRFYDAGLVDCQGNAKPVLERLLQ